MKQLETLTKSEKEMLLRFPAYISLLAANNDEGLDDTAKKSAVKFPTSKHFRATLCYLIFINKQIMFLKKTSLLLTINSQKEKSKGRLQLKRNWQSWN